MPQSGRLLIAQLAGTYRNQLQALARLDLGAPWLRAVCHDNAAALLGL